MSHIALTMFTERGFDETTIDDIAEAAGIGRRTFFRYFASKNDLPWGDFEDLLEGLRRTLDGTPKGLPLFDALEVAVVEFNRVSPNEVPFLRQRMQLILNVPSLVAHSTLRYASWRRVIAEYAARRLDVPADSLGPQSIAWALLGVATSAYEQWLRVDDADLAELISNAFAVLRGTLGTVGDGDD